MLGHPKMIEAAASLLQIETLALAITAGHLLTRPRRGWLLLHRLLKGRLSLRSTGNLTGAPVQIRRRTNRFEMLPGRKDLTRNSAESSAEPLKQNLGNMVVTWGIKKYGKSLVKLNRGNTK
jgi:hypothetical protein